MDFARCRARLGEPAPLSARRRLEWRRQRRQPVNSEFVGGEPVGGGDTGPSSRSRSRLFKDFAVHSLEKLLQLLIIPLKKCNNILIIPFEKCIFAIKLIDLA